MKSKICWIHRTISQSNNLQSLLGNLGIAALGFANFALLARGLPGEGFGQWALYAAAASLLEMVRAGLVQFPLQRFLPGQTSNEQQTIAGAAWWLSLAFTLPVSALVWLAGKAGLAAQFPAFSLFFDWFPLSFLASLPFYQAYWLLQVRQRFGRLFWLRLVYIGGFTCLLVPNLFWRLPLEILALLQVAVQTAGSLLALCTGMAGGRSLWRVSFSELKKMWRTGRFTAGAALATHLLKSSDTIVIGMLMGPAAAGLYSIPLKLTEMLAIPLRSFVANAGPQVASAVNTRNPEGLQQVYHSYTGTLTWLYAAAAMGVVLLARPLVTITGGSAFAEAVPLLQCLMLYHFLLPADRFGSLLLDSLDRADLSLLRLLLMLVLNVGGNVLVIYLGGGLPGVALTSGLVFAAGTWLGYWLLNRQLPLHWRATLQTGWRTLGQLYRELRGRQGRAADRSASV